MNSWCRSAMLALILVATASATSASAQSIHDGQLWTLFLVTKELPSDWLIHMEGQPRWSNDMSDLNQVILRTALGKRIGPRMSVWGGYALVPRTLGPGTQWEQRAWQQFSATFPNVEKWTPSLRIRSEQRFLDGWGDNAHRLRLLGRGVRPLDANRRWSLVGYDEFMLALDETPAGPAQGIDQNRLFGGLLRRLTPTTTVEGGYLWQTFESPNGVRTHAHVAMLWLNVTI